MEIVLEVLIQKFNQEDTSKKQDQHVANTDDPQNNDTTKDRNEIKQGKTVVENSKSSIDRTADLEVLKNYNLRINDWRRISEWSINKEVFGADLYRMDPIN
jgi:hypothetical protein